MSISGALVEQVSGGSCAVCSYLVFRDPESGCSSFLSTISVCISKHITTGAELVNHQYKVQDCG